MSFAEFESRLRRINNWRTDAMGLTTLAMFVTAYEQLMWLAPLPERGPRHD